MPCFVHDGRQEVTPKYTVLFMLSESMSPDFRLTHAKALPNTGSYHDLMVIKARPINDTGA
jgi:hypothetical protein